jgi:hypothetical protein
MNWLTKPLPVALLLVSAWIICRLAVLWHTGIPQSSAGDEFSYLLQADIFAHGHLAMPPHSLGQFFESPHILVRPVYASKYPPGQALFLAAGTRLFGKPFYGVLLGNALMLFALCLMLHAWVPPPWALAVSVMFGLILQPRMYWTNSYWGGSVAASGGALVLLGIGMYRTRQTWPAGVVFAIGALLLFETRPFEGGIFTLLVLLVFAREIWRKRRASVLAATFTLFAVGLTWTCSYNRAITGHPLQLPYLLHDRQYNVTPVFWFLPLRPEPIYSHPRLAAQHGRTGWEAGWYHTDLPRWQLLKIGFMGALQSFNIAPCIAISLTLLVPVAWRDPIFRRMVIICGVFLVALTVETFHFPHYDAPLWAALALMIAIWVERTWNLRIRKQRVGVLLVVLALVSPTISSVGSRVVRQLHASSDPGAGVNALDWESRRVAMIRRLSAFSQQQLVIVRYPSPDWNINEEWVYNGSDIDHQRVVLAHDLGWEQNRALLAYYPDRVALLLTFAPKSGAEKLEPYPREQAQQQFNGSSASYAAHAD